MKKKITEKTRIVGIFGDPIEHSLSPVIQNAAFEALDIDLLYLPFHVRPEELEGAVDSIRVRDMAGVNITIPHKESVIELLDDVTDEARAIGAVNTVVNDSGRLIGHNTDGSGYVRSLKEEAGFECAGKSIVMLGAGGAARGILYTMLKAGAIRVAVSNRKIERAEALINDFKDVAEGAVLKTVPFEKAPLKPHIEEADLLLNTTSLGMSGKVAMNTLLLSLDSLPPGALVSDIVYKPYETVLLKSARRAGAETHRGLGMLIFQGAIGFELWTGKEAPVEVMRKAALRALEITLP